MRTIIDQNGIKWTVTVSGSKFSLGVGDSSSKQISIMTLKFEPSRGEVRLRTTGERPIETFSDDELLELLSLNENGEA